MSSHHLLQPQSADIYPLKEILDNFSEFLPKFKKVLPYDYDRMLRVIASVEERGLDGEQAQIEAFYTVQKKK